MDIDENDLLSTNVFIRNPNLINNFSETENKEFVDYFKENLNKKENENLLESISKIDHTENEDDSFLDNTNKFLELDASSLKSKFDPKRDFKEVITTVNIDSRDRDIILYPKPNNFDIFLGKTFNFIKQIKLVSIEFPNTNAVINSFNNRLYWINKEDIESDIIDSITGYYPIYSVELRIGSYLADTLAKEMMSKMNALKRKNNTSDFHYFDITLDNETDIVSFTSLTLIQLINDPVETLSGTGTIKIRSQNHGFVTGELVYIIGCKTISGISSTVLNGSFIITVINDTYFQYEINVNAADTSIGGGNTVKTGKEAPFQFLFGDYPLTVAQNIGFPVENSSERINTFIKSINKFYQVQIILDVPHNFTSDSNFIGQVCNIDISNTTPSIDGQRVITEIINSTTFLISVNSNLDFPSFNSGIVTFNSIVYNIISISNFATDAILIETFAYHNYTLSDIGTLYTISNTQTTPVLDGLFKITSVFSPTQFIIAGTLLANSSVSTPGLGGYLPRHNPLISTIVNISNVIKNTNNTTIICNQVHNLKTNQEIMIYNLVTSPEITLKSVTVIAIIDTFSFIIDFKIDSFDQSSLTNANFGINILTLSFPNHGFNEIHNIYNGLLNIILIDTLLPHNFINGQIVRITNTNCVPSIDGSYIITVVDSDTFSINLPHITTVGTYGIIGKSNDFSLYSVNSFSGISTSMLNNNKFSISEIIDINTFSFKIGNAFTKTNATGGGDNIFISSLKHGFSGTQNNTKNNILNRSINLQGENYSFICSTQLSNMVNTGPVKNIFARVLLDQSPSNVVFNFLSNPKTFDLSPLPQLDSLTLSVVNYDNTLYEFNDLDYSMALEITELISTSNAFNLSSQYQNQQIEFD
jgi:hypothetical protein